MRIRTSQTRPTTSRRNFVAGAAGIAGAAIATPAFAGPGFLARATAARAQDGAVFRMGYPNFPTLDPQFVTNGMWFAAEGLLEGVTKLAEGGTVAEPAAAESWEVSDDGLTYTFHIREHNWSNGDPVTANDFEWTYQRLLTPSSAGAGVTLGANSFQPALGIVGATDFFAGRIESWDEVGITAIDDRTLEFQLEYANAEFPLLLTHPSMLPLHQATVEASEEWILPENWVGNGPFVPESWSINTEIRLVPNEEYWDREAVTLSAVEVALAETAAGEAAIAYESGERDFVSLSLADVVRFQADPELSQEVHSAPAGTVAYLATLRSKNPILEDVNIRKALSLGMSRDVIGQIFPNSRVGRQLVPDSLEGWNEDHNTPQDIEQAKQILADAGYPDGEGFPEVKILFNAENIAIEALADTWRENLGITVGLDMVEAGVYVERRWAVQEEDYIGFYFGTFGSTPTWSTWVASLWSPQFIQEFSLPADVWAQYQEVQTNTDLTPAERNEQLLQLREENASEASKAFEQAVEDAFTIADPDEQRAALQEAALLRQETYLILPFYYVDAFWAQKPEVGEIDYIQGGLHFYYKTLSKS
jgi:oligopeptide transport system substrate-binding protein